MAKRSIHYMRKSIKELFEIYEDENHRINESDAQITKDLIKNEINERVQKVFRVLDGGDTVNVDSLYNEFIQAAERSIR